MFSIKLSKEVCEIEDYSFLSCFCLQNMAFLPDDVFGDAIFILLEVTPKARQPLLDRSSQNPQVVCIKPT